MRKAIFLLFVIYIAGCSSGNLQNNSSSTEIKYYVDVTNHEADDLFHVTVLTDYLTEENNIYNMAATAPGTYQVMDFGRFVSDMKAFDEAGNELRIEKISDNQWKIQNPQQLSKLIYEVEDTFDAEVTEHPVAPMSGTGIENDFISMNTFGVLGYFEGLQTHPVEMKIDCNPEWEIGTSLNQNSSGYYFAESYDHLADSPVLMGELTVSQVNVNDMPVDIYVYSPDTNITAETILSLANDVLQSSSEFIGYKPAPQYKFLMALINMEQFNRNKLYGAGALEHNLSSLYVMPVNPNAMQGLRSTMAHEFLHILTPLNLHSEIIHTYNFVVPTPSAHVWLYEGVTEWASDIMQLRAGLMNFEEFGRQVTQKMRVNDNFNREISLIDMSLHSYDDDGYGQFINFYNRGALTAMCLDIELLEASGGTRGLREVFIELLKEYGKNKPFPENEFLDVFVQKTNPGIKVFIDKYIRGSEQLPVVDYMNKLGYKYIAERESEGNRPSMGMGIGVNGQDIVIANVSDLAKEWGFQNGDVIIEALGEEVNMQTIQPLAMKIFSMKPGDEYTLKVRRGEEELELRGVMIKRKDRHIFEELETLTPEQIKLREVWSKNL
ncbi:MAG: hypothetical protein K9J16_00805 [Melioribacteraceae bacterium]|nr:hypothetical protein [Melioribacteraceae bacterium]MCF8356367.1 hypothetical protein [Melioribacteraceae bacterium]MCF8392265.1 hypothetical protein [Melioribacteraceae bacterium]MCF8417597.1 hypothetical protein [Melioribacteraceae bacterium]